MVWSPTDQELKLFHNRRMGQGRRRAGGLGGGGRGAAGGAPQKILDFSTGTFTRPSTGWYYPTPNTQAALGSNVLRTMDDPVGTGPMPLFEGSTTNLIDRSEQFSNAVWVKTNVTVTADQVAAPDGTSEADQLAFGAAAADNIAQTLLGATVPDNSTVSFSVWLRTASGTKDLRIGVVQKDGASHLSGSITVTSTWQRFEGNVSSGAGASQVIAELRNAAAGGAGTVYAWGAMVRNSSTGASVFADSYIETVGGVATRAADTLTFAAFPMAGSGFNSRWSIRFSPYWVNGKIASRVILCFGSSANELQFVSSAGAKIRIVESSVVRVETAALAFSPHQLLSAIIDPVAGTVELSGFTVGNGVHTGAPWTWGGTPLVRVGGRSAGSNEFFGRIEEPYAA